MDTISKTTQKRIEELSLLLAQQGRKLIVNNEMEHEAECRNGTVYINIDTIGREKKTYLIDVILLACKRYVL